MAAHRSERITRQPDHAGDESRLDGLTANVDAEVELGVVIGATPGSAPADAMGHVFGYTIVNDVSSRDPWLDGDQWLLGKSMAGFCPVGPWIVTAEELDPATQAWLHASTASRSRTGARPRCGSRSPRSSSYLGRHVELRPGDLIATGTPARLATPPGPDRHLRAGDVVTCWIEGIGELTSTIA